MKRLAQHTVIGSALLLACVACASGVGGSSPSTHPSPSSAKPSLLQLPVLNLADDPLSEQDVSTSPGGLRVLGEVRNGPDRLIIYTAGHKCGLVTTRKGDESNFSIQVLTAWPEDSTQGSASLPHGPYLNSSAKGSQGTWASLSCGKEAMIIKFFSPKISKSLNYRGSLDVIKSPNSENPVSIVVGTREVREKISAALGAHS